MWSKILMPFGDLVYLFKPAHIEYSREKLVYSCCVSGTCLDSENSLDKKHLVESCILEKYMSLFFSLIIFEFFLHRRVVVLYGFLLLFLK